MPFCLVALPSGPIFNVCYEVLQRALKASAVQPLRAGALDRPHAFEQIRDGLEKACACVVDLTGHAEVPLYVLGMAHGAAKPVLLLAQDASHLPWDLRLGQHIIYRPLGPRWDDMLMSQLRSALRDVAGVVGGT
jgi:hypothetical protein